MASAVTTQRFFDRHSIKAFDHDPNASTAIVVSGDGGTTKNYLDMRGYETFALDVMNSVSTSSSGPTLVEILAADDTTGTNATVITTSGTVASVTVGDNILVECTAAQIAEVSAAGGFALRYVTGRITCSNSGDECVVNMIRSGGPAFLNQSANNIT